MEDMSALEPLAWLFTELRCEADGAKLILLHSACLTLSTSWLQAGHAIDRALAAIALMTAANDLQSALNLPLSLKHFNHALESNLLILGKLLSIVSLSSQLFVNLELWVHFDDISIVKETFKLVKEVKRVLLLNVIHLLFSSIQFSVSISGGCPQ